MRLDFETEPLSIFRQSSSESLLGSLKGELTDDRLVSQPLWEMMLGSMIRSAASAGLLAFIDNVTIALWAGKARRCLAEMIREQSSLVSRDTSKLLPAAQKTLIATSCMTSYLGFLESGSFGNAGRLLGKTLFSMVRDLSFQSGLETIAKDVIRITEKYEDICQVYHVAFLLTVYKAAPQTREIVEDLIMESLCKDAGGESSFSGKKRPILFADISYKTLEDNETHRLNILSGGTQWEKDIYDPFIKHREKTNKEKMGR